MKFKLQEIKSQLPFYVFTYVFIWKYNLSSRAQRWEIMNYMWVLNLQCFITAFIRLWVTCGICTNSDHFSFSFWLKATCSPTCCLVLAGSFDFSQKWAICLNERPISSGYFQKLSKPLFTAVYSALVVFGWGKPQQRDRKRKKTLTAGLFFC